MSAASIAVHGCAPISDPPSNPLIRPLEVFGEVARVLRPGEPFACTFSNRCFPTKAMGGRLSTNAAFHVQLVAGYFRRSAGWDQPRIDQLPTAVNGATVRSKRPKAL